MFNHLSALLVRKLKVNIAWPYFLSNQGLKAPVKDLSVSDNFKFFYHVYSKNSGAFR